ncbi:MAG TPA: FecR family protein [Spirochaetia bacterium]|nr:FecR family protein [Spirochaetia bacterium]
MKRARPASPTAIALILLLLSGAVAAYAQKAPVMTLDYFDNADQITVTNKDGMAYQFVNLGMQLTPGDQVSTRSSTAELRLDPNGTIIKLAPYTAFTVDSVAGVGPGRINGFTLQSGTLHAVVARVAGTSYEFRTNAAVGGIRGTDFGMLVIPGKADQLFVKEGLVEFTKTGGQTVQVGSGQFADALAPTFQAVSLSGQQIADLFKNLSFTKLDPGQVPGQQIAQPTAPTENAPPETPQKAETPAPPKSGGGSSFLANFLSLEIGGVTIDGVTYSKLVLGPHFQIGKLKAALYLPIIYSSNVLDPADWYRPNGNNEWSFGSDQSTFIAGAQDFLTDLMLKINYVEWGNQRDPFFFKIGNLNDMTLGHGLLVRNFANNADFPAVRRTGLNLGLDFKSVGFETVVNDLANPEIFGGRFYMRPLGKSFPLALGLSAVTDLSPASEVPTLPAGTSPSVAQAYADAVTANPLFLTIGADLDFPLAESDRLSAILFADVAGLFPYLRNSVAGLSTGLHSDAVLYVDPAGKHSLRNYAASTGVLGNVLALNYRLEYRIYNGVIHPDFFDTVYERLRGQYAADVMTYLENPTDSTYNQVTMGIYGEAGFTLFSAIDFQAGYFWPWTWDAAGNLQYGEDDYLKLMLAVHKKKLPLGIYGSISYERTKFVPTLLGKSTSYGKLSLFDANTAVVGEIVYPIAPPLDLMMRVTTTVRHDSAGNVVYDTSGNPMFSPSVTIETRIGF